MSSEDRGGWRSGRRDGDDLAAGLARARAEADADIAGSHAAARVRSAVLAETGNISGHRRLRWLAIAAALVLAAGLGGFVETARLQAAASADVVAFDPLTFGALAADQ